MGKFVKAFSVVKLAIFGMAISSVSLAADLPSIKVGRGDLVSLSSANSYYGAGITHTDVLSAVRAAELKALANSLNNDVDLIYAFVKNTVEITPMFGLQKGALGAYIDRHGTAFDQAQLMVELLREAGYQNVNYQYGEISLNGVEFNEYYGITDARAACNMLAYGGIPGTVNSSSNCASLSGSVSTVVMKHVWVKADVSGVPYVFDPAYKKHQSFVGISLDTAMGYSRSTFKASAGGSVSGTQSGVSYVQDYSPVNIKSNLESYSSNLLNVIKTSHTEKPLHEIIGGEKVITEEVLAGGWRLQIAGYPYTLSGPATWTEVPDQFRTIFRVCARRPGLIGSPATCDGSVADVWGKTDTINTSFFVDEIYGRKLEIVPTLNQSVMRNYNMGAFSATLMVDEQSISGTGIDALHSNTEGVAGRMGWTLELEVDHPYAATSGAYMDRTIETQFDLLTTANIVHGWGYVSNNLMTKWTKEYGNDSAVGGFTAESCKPECEPFQLSQQDNTKAKLGAAWLAQFSRMADMAGDISGGEVIHHHSVGVSFAETQIANDCNQESGDCSFTPGDQMLRLDLSTGLSALHPDDASAGLKPKENALIHTVVAAASTLEGSLFEQQMDSVDVSSTAKRFKWAEENLAGAKYMRFTPADSGVVDSLVLQAGYNPVNCLGVALPNGDMGSARIEAYLDENYDEVLAVNDEFLGPGYECGPSQKTLGSLSFYMTHASLQRGSAFIAIRKDASGNVTDIAHVVTTREGSYKGGSGANNNDDKEQFDPAKAADILKDEFKDKSVLHGVDLASGAAAWSSGVVLSTGNGGFPYALSLELKVQNGIVPPDSVDVATRHWNYGNYSTQIMTGNMRSEATMSGSGMEAMGASHAWNAVGTIAALYATYDIAVEATDLDNLVLLPFINEWWSDQLSHNVVSISSPAGGYQFVRLPDGSFNAPAGSAATLSVAGDRVAVRHVTNAIPSQTRHWDYGSVDFTVTTEDKSTLFFDAVAYFTNERGEILGHKQVLKNIHNVDGFGVNFTYDIGTVYRGIRLAKVSNDFGRELNWVYDASTVYQINSVNDGNGNSVSFTSQSGREGFTNPEGGFTGFDSAITPTDARPSFGFQLGKVYLPIDSTNAALEYSYNEVWQTKEVKDAEAVLGNRAAYQFQIAESFRGSRIDPLTNSYSAWYGLYDGTVDYGKFIDETGRVVRTEFDDRGRVTARQFPEGNRAEFTYDNYNNVTQMRQISKDSSQTLTANASYNNASFKNLPTSVTDALGNITTLEYYGTGLNGAGKIKKATRPTDKHGAAAIYNYEYNTHGQLSKSTNPEGEVAESSYNAVNGDLLSTVFDPTGLNYVTSFTYDALGNQLTVNGPRTDVNDVTTKIFDVLRRPTRITAPDNSYVISLYDANGRQTGAEKYSAAGILIQKTKTEYTATGQTWKTYGPECYIYPGGALTITNAGCNITTTDYDDVDRPEYVTDGKGRQTKTLYYPDGQVDKIIKAFGTAIQQDYASYTYWPSNKTVADAGDYNGQQKSVMDANGNVTRYDHDGHDRLSHFRLPSQTMGSIAIPNDPDNFADYEQYEYNGNGQMVTKRTRRGDLIFTQYDNLNRVIGKTTCDVLNGYDSPLSSLPANCAAATNGTIENDISYDYDLVDRQIDVRFVGTQTHYVTNSYNSAGQLITTNDNGRILSYLYADKLNRTKVQWPDGYSADYVYDNMNRVTTIKENGTATLATYAYDTSGRRASITLGNGTITSYSYHDDDALNTLSHNVNNTADDVDWTYGFNAVNQLTSKVMGGGINLAPYKWEPQNKKTDAYTANGLNQYSNVAGSGITYDASGNLTSDGVWNYDYDVENMLLNASRSGASASYIYDPLGRRSAKTVDTVLTTFLHDGVEEIADYNSSGTLLRRYVHGPGVDEYLVMYTGSGTTNKSYFHANHQGSIIAMSDGAGDVTEQHSYDAYGNSDELTGNPFRYTGRRLDEETGLYYYRARYYSPAIGRFLQTDPIGYGDGLNWYAYVQNDPLNGTDPSGENEFNAKFKALGGFLLGGKGKLGVSFDTKNFQLTVTTTVGAGEVSGTFVGSTGDIKPSPDNGVAVNSIEGSVSIAASGEAGFGGAVSGEVVAPILTIGSDTGIEGGGTPEITTDVGIGLGAAVAATGDVTVTVKSTIVRDFLVGHGIIPEAEQVKEENK